MSIGLGELKQMLGDARGRAARPLPSVYIRDLCEEDAEALLAPEPSGVGAQPLKRLRSQHHSLARMLAAGAKNVEASLATGYSQATISRLCADPAFKELLAYYQGQAEMQFIDVQGKLALLGETVVEELQERIEENVEAFSVQDLLRVGEFALDRSSAPPKTKQNTPTTNFPQISISFHEGTQQAPLLGKDAPLTIEYSEGEAVPDETS